MRGIMILLTVVTLAVSFASATVITWDVKINDDGTNSRYRIKAMADDRDIVGFDGTFYCSENILQMLGDPDGEEPCDYQQIDKRADASAADDGDCPFDKNKDSHVWTAFNFVPDPFVETNKSYGGGAGSAPFDENQGSYVYLVQLVAKTDLDFQQDIGEGDFGFRGKLMLWEGQGHDAYKEEHNFGVPEPATVSLLVIGGVAGLLRRRKR